MKVKDLRALRESAKKGVAVPTEVRLYVNGGNPFRVVAPLEQRADKKGGQVVDLMQPTR